MSSDPDIRLTQFAVSRWRIENIQRGEGCSMVTYNVKELGPEAASRGSAGISPRI